MLFKTILAFFPVFQVIAVHGAVIKAVGDEGGNIPAFRIDATSRDGSRRDPFQGDKKHSRIVNVDVCGNTVEDGSNC
ncbi:hypothetical protein HI914_06698 [Erysiphe necator]|uniref:Uncharacterized protein n=1 Tax=Uncinula necator TaxID=52586 RepID=A0A0B1P0G5_UNCNE|nr:hypothetical protein HI914_06698 [Erysiphe necator]KHJ32147.1 hypothetical protein EV44_g0274 [Erysiphe necator]